MAKKHLIVVHGMGDHTEDSVKAEVVGTLTTVFSWYPSLQNTTPESEFKIIPFAYNHYFEEYRNAVADRQELLAKLGALPGIGEIVANLSGSVTGDNFFNTHWLDVLLYRSTLHADPIRLDLAVRIGTSIRDVGSTNVHVMGHSLGTSLVHDTLCKMYGPEPSETNYSVVSQKLGGVHQVSNVSRLLQSFRKVGASEVRPGTGCCVNFIEYRHKLDPFTKVKPFNPMDNGDWVSHDDWENAYRLIEPSSVINPNVHSLPQYLADPLVHQPLLKLLFGFRPRKAEKDAAREAFNAQTLSGKANALRDAFDNLDFSQESINTFINAGAILAKTIESFGDSFS